MFFFFSFFYDSVAVLFIERDMLLTEENVYLSSRNGCPKHANRDDRLD